MSRAVDLTIIGEVQGVGYRMSAAQEAHRLGVTGWVRNEADGSVAAHVEGDDDAVTAMVAWCRGGPAWARVAGVDVREAAAGGARSFEVR